MAGVCPTSIAHSGQQKEKAGERQVQASPVFLLFAGAQKNTDSLPGVVVPEYD
jgi:hypothetical protein